jgi:hypothetical protein
VVFQYYVVVRLLGFIDSWYIGYWVEHRWYSNTNIYIYISEVEGIQVC